MASDEEEKQHSDHLPEVVSDDVHNEKAQVGRGYSTDFVPPTPEEEAKLIRKLDLRLLPLVFLLYTLSVLDRSNLGNAKLAGMKKDIDLSGNRYNFLGTLFYIAYILFQWTLIGWKHFKPHNFCAVVVLFWGFVASVQAAAFNYKGLLVCRFFLGIAEAMYGPGVPLYLSFFYPREKIGFRHGVFISGAAMANVYGSVLAYGIAQIKGALAPWRILFLIEGLPTCAVALLAWWFLPDSIREAPFLSEREKAVALHFTARNQRVDVGKEHGVRFSEMFEAFKDPKSFLPAIMYFSCNVSFSSLPLFVPTIISEMGSFTTVASEGLSGPPYALCFFVILIFCWLSDRYKMRGPFVFASGLIAAVGFIINATVTSSGPRYFSIFLSVQIFAAVALLLAWTANLHATESQRSGGYTILATIGQCGPLLGTNVFPESEKPYYRKGMWISAAFCLLVAGTAVVLSLWLIHENKQMDKEGVPEVEEFEDTSVQRASGKRERHRHVW